MTTPSPPPAESRPQALARWGSTAALVPLRLFLGVTFIFAGLQKLANPNFFNRNSPISIWSQLVGAQRNSPIHFLVGHLLKVATPLGVLIAVGEVAIGLGVLLGLMTRVAAAGGMLLSLGLFLTVSFHSSPYYTGADIVFFFALTPLLLGGAGELLALDPLLRRRAMEIVARRQRYRSAAGGRRPSSAGALGPGYANLDFEPTRRALLAKAVATVGAGGVVVMGLDGLIGRALGGAHASTATPQLGGGNGTATTSSAPSGAATTTTVGTSTPPAPTTTAAPTGPVASTPPGKALGLAKQVPVGGAAMFQDPATGDPGIVVQQTAGKFVAFDAVCPHAGCTVGYNAPNNLIVCPCHGSVFNPDTGAVEQGPAAQGLRPIQIAEGPDGELYAV